MSFARVDGWEVRPKRRYARIKVLIGVDPHKASLAVVALDEATGELLSGTTLTQIFAISPILAARIIGTVGDVRRFPTPRLTTSLPTQARRRLRLQAGRWCATGSRWPETDTSRQRPAHVGGMPGQLGRSRRGLLLQEDRGGHVGRSRKLPKQAPSPNPDKAQDALRGFLEEFLSFLCRPVGSIAPRSTVVRLHALLQERHKPHFRTFFSVVPTACARTGSRRPGRRS
jgi:hypothetical protein